VDITVRLSEPYPVEFDYYLENADNLFISVTNTTASGLQVYYHVAVIGDNGLEARTKPNIKPASSVNIPSFRTLFYTGNDLTDDFPFDYPSEVEFVSITTEQLAFLNNNRALPEGNYSVCVTVIDFNTDVILGSQCSDEFTVSYGDSPIIIMPFNGEIVPESPTHHVTIGWEPPFTNQPATGAFTYNLKVVDITGYAFGDIELLMNNPGTYPILDVTNISELIYNYDFPPETELTPGHQYAIRVQAVNTTGNYPLPNNGYSEISTFWYSHDDQEEEIGGGGSTASCESGNCELFPVNPNARAVASISNFNELYIGHFTIKELSITSADGNNASGTGTITIPFFDNAKIKVNFSGVKIDPTKRIIDGVVEAVNDYEYDPTAATPNDISNFDRFVRSERLISKFIGGRDRTMSMPIGIVWNIGGEHLMLAVNTMSFSPTRANCQVMYNMHYPQWNDYWLSLSASDICMMPDGFGQEFYMHPVVDIPLVTIGDTEYIISGTTSNAPDEIFTNATFVQVDCHGIANVGHNIEVRFSRAIIVPDNPDGSQGSGKVSGWITATTPRTSNTTELGNDNGYQVGFLGQFSMDRFQIRNLPGLGFELQQGWADCSDTRNPVNMTVPTNYQSPDLTNDNGTPALAPVWQGFYLKSLSAQSAQGWLFDEERLTFSVRDMIIDDLITANINVANIITNGNVGGWFISLDTLFLQLVQWSSNNTGLWNAGLHGRIGMPITGPNEFFKYTGLIQPQESGTAPNMALIIRPHETNITFPFMQAGVVNLCSNSFVRLVQENGNTFLESQLAGNMAVTFPSPVSVTIPYLDFQFGYHSANGFSNQAFSILGQPLGDETADCDNLEAMNDLAMGTHNGTNTGGNNGGNTGAGSNGNNTSGSNNNGNGNSSGNSNNTNNAPLPPPMPSGTPVSANNFPMNIEDIGIEQININNVNFNILPAIELGGGGQSGFAAKSDFQIRSTMKNKKLVLEEINIEKLEIDVEDVYGINIHGTIEFYEENNDKGARGELSVDLPLKISTDLKADFGVRAINTNQPFGATSEYFGYWYVDGMVGFPGIPLVPGIHLHGLGGGVYVNMQRNDGFSNGNLSAVQGVVNDVLGQIPNNGLTAAPESLRPSPAFGTYGLKIATRLATPIEAALNMDVSLAGTFTKGTGITALSIDGAAYMMCPIDKRESGNNVWATAGLGWERNGNEHTINGNIALYANIANGLLTGTASGNKVIDVAFLAETKTNKWFFKAGEPDNRAGMILDLAIIRQKVNGYFMVGHDLPTELPMPDEVRSLLGRSSGSGSNKLNNPSPVNGTQNRTEGADYYGEGRGIAFGVETSVEFNLKAWALYASLKAYLGFDINITQSEGGTCYIPGAGNIAPGVNGWYATGQIYAGFEGAMGLKGKFLGKEHEFELFQMAAAMLIQGGGPNPTWAEGRAVASYRVLNGLIKGSASFELRVGDKCEPSPEEIDIIPVIHDLTPADGSKQVSVFASDEILATFLLPIDERIEVPILFEPIPGVREVINADLEIYIDEFSIRNNSTNSLVSATKKYSEDHQAITLETGTKFTSFTDYTVTLRVKAKDYTFSSTGTSFKEDGSDWKEERIHAFKTGKTPFPIPDDEVVKTLPIRNQRYFLQDEINVLYKIEAPAILFSMDMGDDEYFPANDSQYSYEYFFRWASYDGDAPIIVTANELGGKKPVELIKTNLPRLKNDTYYSCQLVQKKTKQFIAGNTSFNGSKITTNIIRTSDASYLAHELYRTDTISVDINIDPSIFKNANESIIYQFDLKTSKYNTLADKMANASLSTTGVQNTLSNYPKIQFNMDENFDVFDIEGEFNASTGTYVSLPRIEFSSNLGNTQTHFTQEGTYVDGNGLTQPAWTQDSYQHVPNQGKSGYLNYLNHSIVGFTNMYEEIVAQNPHSITLKYQTESRTVSSNFPSLSTVLSYDGGYLRGNYYDNNITYYIRDKKAEGYDGPLTENELNNQWNNYVAKQNKPLTGGLGITNGPSINKPIASEFTSQLHTASTFTLEYYLPVWTAEDIMDLSKAGAWLLGKTYLWDPMIGNINQNTFGNNNNTESTINPNGSIGKTGTPQVMDNTGNTGGTTGPVQGSGSNNWDTNTYSPIYVNHYSSYLAGKYEALMVQLDLMNHPDQYHQLQNHKGGYTLSIQADRAYLMDQMVPGIKITKDFQYGNTGGGFPGNATNGNFSTKWSGPVKTYRP
jgi:hypothetical protein